ncbi:hypothetical protein COU88_00095 [Candidatus Roizmanbacteria bacterium CG10_big_fil_rev_8_21_14_0_10_39_6]|uniref:Uncharacterized protein n=1 Tax=Candidatus Roizmanbacteria bacterium CG10_big_fil_rev_8_21_14_0_10_39_6 TaxID=1974853 RepID=A0A2M8KTT0_9BACT|nr:MAG: hypothetical protein COU88_00095 [Candidatus Roizmanbacteria bacterium CG10_big_fil_rev_8_21_14_0_10_39_6]
MHVFIYSNSSIASLTFKKLVVSLSQRGNTIVNQDLIAGDAHKEAITTTQRYERTMSALKKADIGIFASLEPSFYDGYFLSLVLSRAIPCIICSNATVATDTFSGCTNPLCYYRSYRDLKDLIYQLAVFGV